MCHPLAPVDLPLCLARRLQIGTDSTDVGCLMVFEDVTQSVRGFDEFTGKRNCVQVMSSTVMLTFEVSQCRW